MSSLISAFYSIVINHKYYKHLKEVAQHCHLGMWQASWDKILLGYPITTLRIPPRVKNPTNMPLNDAFSLSWYLHVQQSTQPVN